MGLVWVEDFMADAQRRGISPKSVKLYRDLFRTITNHHGLDLETVDKDRLFEVLDSCRQTGSPRYYFLKVYMIKRALRFLGRKDLADLIPNPRLPDRGEGIKVIPLEDIDRMIHEASNERDRLIYSTFEDSDRVYLDYDALVPVDAAVLVESVVHVHLERRN